MAKRNCNFVIMTVKEFVEKFPVDEYNSPIYQRDYDSKNSGSILANMAYIAAKTQACGDNMLSFGNVLCTSKGELNKGTFYPQPIYVAVEDGKIIAIFDGQHRVISFNDIMNGNVRIAVNSPNLEISSFCSGKDYMNKKFKELKPRIKKNIENMYLMLYVVEGNDIGLQKALFYNGNCGTTISTTQSMNNNYCETALYQAVSRLTKQIFSGVVDGDFTLSDGWKNIQERKNFNESNIFHLISRCVAINDRWNGSAVKIETDLFKAHQKTSKRTANSMVKTVATNLCLASLIVGDRAPIHLVTGMYMFIINNPDKKKWLKNNRFAIRKKLYARMYTVEEFTVRKETQPVVISAYLSDTAHNKAKTIYANGMIESVAKEMGCF